MTSVSFLCLQNCQVRIHCNCCRSRKGEIFLPSRLVKLCQNSAQVDDVPDLTFRKHTELFFHWPSDCLQITHAIKTVYLNFASITPADVGSAKRNHFLPASLSKFFQSQPRQQPTSPCEDRALYSTDNLSVC